MALLSAIQFAPSFARSPAEVKNNIRLCDDLFHMAWKQGSEFIVLPELFATGYSFMSKDEAMKVCEVANGPTFRAMQWVAMRLKAYLAWGYVELEGKNLYNSATLIGPDGRVVTTYRKVNLFSSDFMWATSGDKPASIVTTDFGRTSVVVCRDLRDKIPQNIPRFATPTSSLWDGQPVDLVAACVNWGKSGGFPSNSWMDFVANNRCNLIIANRWGIEQNNGYSQDFGPGGSCIIEKNWKVHIDGLKWDVNAVVTANIGL